MKANIKITDQYGNIEYIRLEVLKKRINERRKWRLHRLGYDVNIMTTDNEDVQPACHYTSFEINNLNLEKALTVFNDGGVQVAEEIPWTEVWY